MDTCSRFEEPGGVGWKDVNAGRLRTTTSGKPSLVASSGRSIGSVAKELGLRDSVLRRWVEQRGAGLEPTAASRRPTTQARLPSADHAAEIARREGAVRIEAEEGSEADCRMVISPVAALHVRSVFHGAWLATSTTSYPLGPTQGPRIATIFAGR